jgi:indole-3-glycerol phosphate synthase
MSQFLDAILATKKEEVLRLRSQKIGARNRRSMKRPFIQAIADAQGLAVIAEVKKASPSKGVISASFDPGAIAERYEKGGATAISVLTDEKYFQGSLTYLETVRGRVTLPVLRKDFIIDPVQVFESAGSEADALLLIVAALGLNQMQELYSAALELSMDPLVEVHSMKECEIALKLSPVPRLIGINNRDLNTFKTDVSTTLSIKKNIPHEVMVISESGIGAREQAQMLAQAGVKGILAGESLMRSQDPAALIKELTSPLIPPAPFPPLRSERGKGGAQREGDWR